MRQKNLIMASALAAALSIILPAQLASAETLRTHDVWSTNTFTDDDPLFVCGSLVDTETDHYHISQVIERSDGTELVILRVSSTFLLDGNIVGTTQQTLKFVFGGSPAFLHVLLQIKCPDGGTEVVYNILYTGKFR